VEAGFGGPVWHASISTHDGRRSTIERWTRAARALSGVGDPQLGEWRETGNIAVHLRRRVTADEWAGRPWGMDLRHTPEGQKRLAAPGATAIPAEW
jgi:hypothetical protein